MLTLTADVNGWIIGKVFIHNTGRVSGDIWSYDAAYYDDATREMTLGIEDVHHVRDAGWAPLASEVLTRIKRWKV